MTLVNPERIFRIYLLWLLNGIFMHFDEYDLNLLIYSTKIIFCPKGEELCPKNLKNCYVRVLH